MTGVNPANGTAGAAVTTDVTVTFSEPVDPTTVDNTIFSVNDGAANIAGGVSVAADGLSATFNPDADLVNELTYTVMATSGITDLNGNPLAQDFASTFTTEAAPLPDTPMHVVSIDVSLDQKGPNWQARVLPSILLSGPAAFP